jgi:DnaA family protein
VQLADLRSRLTWGIVYQLAQPNDADKALILQFRATRRGLTLSPGVASYIVNRAPRAMPRLLEVLDRLDKASLAQQRALSIPFVKAALGW